MKRKRTVVHIVFNAETKFWEATIAGMVISCAPVRAQVLDMGRGTMLHLRLYRINGQIVVHRKDGDIAFEYTYGADPKRTRG